MKYSRVLVFALFCITPLTIQAAVTPDDSGNFITTWNTENDGTSNNDQITIPGTGGGYSYEIYWEDTASSSVNGTTTLITTDSYTLTFPAPGIYEVQASGTFPRIYFNNSGDKDKILTVEQWGDIAWSSMERAFYNADNLQIPANDAPDLSQVTSLKLMFAATENFNSPINHWNVSNVQNFSQLFDYAISFNQPLSNWNTANVTNMSFMFRSAGSFNQPIGSWDTSSVTNMKWMFYGRSGIRVPFNQDISEWDVSNVTTMNIMFRNSDFNQPLNDWDVSSVQDFAEMFSNDSVFNQPLNNWNTASATNMLWMFRDNYYFNQDLSSWDTSNVTNISGMFQNASAFDQDLSNWDISSLVRTSSNYPYNTALENIFNDVALSAANQEAIISSFATQASSSGLINLSFNIGLKTYGDTGAAAIQTLESLGWTVVEQYQAQYAAGTDATLVGSGTQTPLTSGATTTAVSIVPDNGCTFWQWSDGDTSNPRQDVLTDNLSVSAEVRCTSTAGTYLPKRAETLREKGNVVAAEEIEARLGSSYSNSDITSSMAAIERLPETIENILATDNSPETIKALLELLLQLVYSLLALQMQSV